MQKTDSQTKMQLISQDNYSMEQTNLTEEPIMYEPESNRRIGVTRKYIHNNKKFYLNVQYDNEALPRVVRVFTESKWGTEYADICMDCSDDVTYRLQTYRNPKGSLEKMATEVPRRSTGEPTTIKGLIVDELIKSYYLD